MVRRKTLVVLAVALGSFVAAVAETQETGQFGTQDYTITTISALSFVPKSFSGPSLAVSPSLGRYCGCASEGMSYYASLDLPAGAVIDILALNSATDTDFVLGLTLWERHADGTKIPVIFIDSATHGWGTQYSGTIGYEVSQHGGRELVLEVEQLASPTPQYFGWVEVWWRRTVSPAPDTATFNDVPTSHPFFQFIEALYASGITAGCGNGDFCPDVPLTRGQMAVFLSKALGLHWPN
jgi:hypothetical protein